MLKSDNLWPEVMAASCQSEVTTALNRFVTVLVAGVLIFPGSLPIPGEHRPFFIAPSS